MTTPVFLSDHESNPPMAFVMPSKLKASEVPKPSAKFSPVRIPTLSETEREAWLTGFPVQRCGSCLCFLAWGSTAQFTASRMAWASALNCACSAG